MQHSKWVAVFGLVLLTAIPTRAEIIKGNMAINGINMS